MITKKFKKENTSIKQNIIKNISKKQNNTIIKNIYIKNNAGFGNKVFDLIFAIYLYNLYNNNNNNDNDNNNKYIIHYVICKSIHDKYNEPKLYNIFPKSKHKVNFITENQYKSINKHKNKILLFQDLKDLKNIHKLIKYENLFQHNEFINNFILAYKMYKTFSQHDKDMFNMNKNILTDKTTLDNITSYSYSLVHIRYGDKLYYLTKYINKPDIDISLITKDKNTSLDDFILYTPEYYIDKINELLEKTPKNMNIYIITDSVNIVKEFIMKTNNNSFSNNDRIVLLDKMTWWDSFYLLYYAKNIILSNSTFSYAGAYFNKKVANCKLLLYHHDETKTKFAKEEYAISPNWKISKVRKYILNYNAKIAFDILKFRYKWTY